VAARARVGVSFFGLDIREFEFVRICGFFEYAFVGWLVVAEEFAGENSSWAASSPLGLRGARSSAGKGEDFMPQCDAALTTAEEVHGQGENEEKDQDTGDAAGVARAEDAVVPVLAFVGGARR
jgi:hypothetical protein